jgi:hypothetical protein
MRHKPIEQGTNFSCSLSLWVKFLSSPAIRNSVAKDNKLMQDRISNTPDRLLVIMERPRVVPIASKSKDEGRQGMRSISATLAAERDPVSALGALSMITRSAP